MRNQIYYTFLAGWCADAAGARLEFRKKRYSEEEAIHAMHFVGEKSNGIHEGQFTDDSEMEICLLQGLINGKGEEEFPVEKIAKEYIKWFNSRPFDIGNTTTMALFDAKNADDMVNNAYQYNEGSESNGSLMRCIPIAAFCVYKPVKTIIDVASVDASLTHYSEVVHLITGIYCCIISKILSQRLQFPDKNINIEKLIELIKDIIANSELSNMTAIQWVFDALKMTDLSAYDAISNEGHVKHAFIFFIYFLKNINHFTYEKAIIEVLKCGGDTDTNAKIVGNLFGAYYGDCVPNYMSEPVLNFDCTKAEGVYKRPKKYGIKNAIKLVGEI
jgi:ADP-ribosylglycohydrolase